MHLIEKLYGTRVRVVQGQDRIDKRWIGVEGTVTSSPRAGDNMIWIKVDPAKIPSDIAYNTQAFRFDELETVEQDPMSMNAQRAAWAHAAVMTFIEQTRSDYQDAVADLLCDLMHLCDRDGMIFADELARAANHHAEECREDAAAPCVLDCDEDAHCTHPRVADDK